MNEDTSKDSDANIKSSQTPQVAVTTTNDNCKADAKNRPLIATLPVGKNYDHETNTICTIVGSSMFDNVQVQSLVAEHKQSFNNFQDACSNVMMPISFSI